MTDQRTERLGDLGTQPRSVTFGARAAEESGDRQRLPDEIAAARRAADGDRGRNGGRGEHLAQQLVDLVGGAVAELGVDLGQAGLLDPHRRVLPGGGRAARDVPRQ
jgi:hypothetical protein